MIWVESGTAQTTQALSLDSLLIMAAQNNPEVKTAYYNYLAALEKVPQVGALPDPQAAFGFFLKPMPILGGSQVGSVQVMQMFPWFGTLETAKDEASEMAKAKYNLFEATKSDLFFRVKSNWYQLMKLDREVKLTIENIELLESIEKLVLIKFQSPVSGGSSKSMGSSSKGNMNLVSANTAGGSMGGMSSAQTISNSQMSSPPSSVVEMGGNSTGLQTVLQVKMEILDLQNRMASLRDQRVTEKTKFNTLLNREVSSSVVISDSLIANQMPVGLLSDSILTNNPMLSMIGSEIAAYNQMELKAKKMGKPMMGVGLNYMINQKRDGNTSMMNGDDMIMPMVSITLPIYRKKYNAMRKEAQLNQEAGRQQAVSLTNDLRIQYQLFVQNSDDARRRIDLYSEQTDLARRTMSLLLAEFETSGSGYEEVLRMQAKVLDYGFKHIEAIVDYNTSVALVEKLMNSLDIN